MHRFLAAGPAPAASGRATPSQLVASAKWAVRAGLHRVAPPAARALFTLHYACLCLPADRRSGRRDPSQAP